MTWHRPDRITPMVLRRLRLFTATSSYDRFVMAPLLIAIAHDFEVSLKQAALAASTYYLCYGLSQLGWAALSDRLGRIVVIRIGLLVGGGAALLSIASSDFSLTVAARAVCGLAFAAVVPSVIVYVGDTFPAQDRQSVLASIMVATQGGIIASCVFGGAAALAGEWRVAIVMSAVLGCVGAVATWQLHDSEVPRRLPPRTAFLAVARSGWTVVVVGLAITEGTLAPGVLTYLAPLAETAGADPLTAGAVVAASGFGGIGGAMMVSLVRLSAKPVATAMAAGGLAIVTGLAAAACAPPVGRHGVGWLVLLVGVAAVCIGSGFAMMHTALQAWITEVDAEHRSLRVGLFVTGLFGGSALGTAVAAPWAARTNFAVIFWTAAFVGVVLTAGAMTARNRYERGRTS